MVRRIWDRFQHWLYVSVIVNYEIRAMSERFESTRPTEAEVERYRAYASWRYQQLLIQRPLFELTYEQFLLERWQAEADRRFGIGPTPIQASDGGPVW